MDTLPSSDPTYVKLNRMYNEAETAFANARKAELEQMIEKVLKSHDVSANLIDLSGALHSIAHKISNMNDIDDDSKYQLHEYMRLHIDPVLKLIEFYFGDFQLDDAEREYYEHLAENYDEYEGIDAW